MKLKDYQFYLSIEDLPEDEKLEKQMSYLCLDFEKHSIDEIKRRIFKVFSQRLFDYKAPRKWFYIPRHGIWKVSQNIRKEKGSQFTFFESFLFDESQITQNLHNLLAIYIRPLKWYGIEKWDVEKHSKNASVLLETDMKYIYPILDFFFLSVKNYIRNTNIISLNKQTMEIQKDLTHLK